MQIVIKIPDSKYQSILSDNYCGLFDADMCKAIKDGVPLPKGHGRLGDLDAICKDVIEALGIRDETFLLEAEKAVYKRIKNASTIIEAYEEG